MGLIFGFKKMQKAKCFLIGSTLAVLTVYVSISRAIAEKIAKEKGIDLNEAIDFITESIKEGYNTLK